jgi:hypothetical protein
MSPLLYTWTGDSFEILPRFQKEADKRFTVGERYLLEHVEERSARSHKHYFACVNQGWVNLPEAVAERFPTADHLRRFALIKAGFYDHRSIVASSKAEAVRLAAFVRPMDEFCIVTVSESVVNVFTAQSQSQRAMGKEVFQKSKEAVLAVISDMIGAPVDKQDEPA